MSSLCRYATIRMLWKVWKRIFTDGPDRIYRKAHSACILHIFFKEGKLDITQGMMNLGIQNISKGVVDWTQDLGGLQYPTYSRWKVQDCAQGMSEYPVSPWGLQQELSHTPMRKLMRHVPLQWVRAAPGLSGRWANGTAVFGVKQRRSSQNKRNPRVAHYLSQNPLKTEPIVGVCKNVVLPVVDCCCCCCCCYYEDYWFLHPKNPLRSTHADWSGPARPYGI